MPQIINQRFKFIIFFCLLIATILIAISRNRRNDFKLSNEIQDVEEWHDGFITSNLNYLPNLPFQFDSLSCDFGNHKLEEGVQEHRFKIRNTSEEVLIIDKVHLGCSCLKTHFDRKPIEPNDTSSILIRYNPIGRKTGDYRKIIYVTLNDNNYYFLLEIKGNTI